jgi:hypothetical protein
VYEYEHQEAYPKAFGDATAADDEPADGDVDGRLLRFEERMKQQDKVVSYKDMQVAIFRFAACSRFHFAFGNRQQTKAADAPAAACIRHLPLPRIVVLASQSLQPSLNSLSGSRIAPAPIRS